MIILCADREESVFTSPTGKDIPQSEVIPPFQIKNANACSELHPDAANRP